MGGWRLVLMEPVSDPAGGRVVRRWALALAPLAMLGTLDGCKRGGEAAAEDETAAPIPVVCEPAHAAERTERVTLRGVVVAPPDRDVLLSSPISGRVGEIKVHDGERVKA